MKAIIMLILMLMGGTFLVQELRAEGSPGTLPTTDILDIADIGQAISPSDMGLQTGRQGVQIDEMNNVMNSSESYGAVGSNLLTSNSTGTNNVSDNAFGMTNGVATIIQNSGNQNVIQSSFILNMSVK
ncbi:MAG: hypothetical protein J0665_07980 [Deltaproteobacteria bacterium]|nr:hypothetical protein [Deltaproteobacteria bacterium]